MCRTLDILIVSINRCLSKKESMQIKKKKLLFHLIFLLKSRQLRLTYKHSTQNPCMLHQRE
ncbi:CLUMA_CG006660, isoform A [Clunio marinus]|uniref:CLUMA_CG006660, isoform A n=1 Tax=Clunio marinus TaxID=568069 RepID=A0A1J1HYU6_9DIPT|nr:CLUMA_CG006660, isoform A [Clunio marinus]